MAAHLLLVLVPDEELADRLARLRGQDPAARKKSGEAEIHPEEFLTKFPEITTRKGSVGKTAVDIQKLLEEVPSFFLLQ
jgi:hypothetical protein